MNNPKYEYPIILANSLQDCSLNFDDLDSEVSELMEVHTRLEMQIAAAQKPLSMGLAKLRRALGKKPKFTVEEILRMQLEMTRTLRKSLEKESSKTRSSLEGIIAYSDYIDTRIQAGVIYISEARPEIEALQKRIDAAEEALKKLTEDNPAYFEKKHEHKTLERELKELYHKYDISVDAVADYKDHSVYLEYHEALMRATLYTSEEMSEKTRRIESQIAIIKGNYDAMLRQHKLFAALHNALTMQKTYIKSLDGILMKGRSIMQAIVSRSEGLKPYAEGSPLEGIKETIKEEDADKRADAEVNSGSYKSKLPF